MKSIREHYDGISQFDISVKYVETENPSTKKRRSHIHDVCEIYVNLSGDVSFMVEDLIYPISYGDIIISRPFEYHHCIYHSSEIHKHFWILFSSAGNEKLLDVFFKREAGVGNHLILPPEELEDFITHCHKMTQACESESQKYYNFFKLIDFLQKAKLNDITKNKRLPDVTHAISYINKNIDQPITVADVAKSVHVSVNTLERHFKESINLSPRTYMQKKRLANAARLLAEGSSVTEASEKSGFSDYSWFIALFKKTYGITPLQYKKKQQNV